MKLANLVGQALDGKYLIEKQLGKGGMGAVFFATHLGTERPVAVKVIMPQYMKHDEFVERFRREARAAGRMRHPNVVDVTDFGFANVDGEQVAYLVMEYLDGCTLDEVLAEEAKLPFQFALEILEQACSAVEDAHHQGIIHRDLKPDNIWLEPNRRGSYTVKVLDFGIAKLESAVLSSEEKTSENGNSENKTIIGNFAPTVADEVGTLLFESRDTPASVSAHPSNEILESATQIHNVPSVTAVDEISEAATREMRAVGISSVIEDSEEEGTKLFDSTPSLGTHHANTSSASKLTRVGSILGTPLYMSPEQCKGETLDTRTDVYSLGVIAYQMLSGKTPFSGDYQAVMKSHMEEPPPQLKVKGIRKKTANVVMTALAKSPEDRPVSPAALASILRANSEGVGVLYQRALTLFSRHLPSFMKLSLIIFAPLITLTVLQVTNNILLTNNKINSILGAIFGGILGLIAGIISFITGSVLTSVTTWIVTSINAAPLRPIELKPAFIALRRRLKSFLWTSFMVIMVLGVIIVAAVVLIIIAVVLGSFIGKITALVFACIIVLAMLLAMALAMARYALAAPVTLLEGLSGRGALRRSAELTSRSRRTVLTTVFIQMILPVLLTLATMFVISSIVRSYDAKERITELRQQIKNQQANPNSTSNPVENKQNANENKNNTITVETSSTSIKLTTNNDEDEVGSNREKLVSNIFQIVWLLPSVVLGMFAAIVTGLLYLKTRQAGGESIKDVLEDFGENQQRSRWQTKMRDRLSLHTRTSKG